MAKKGLLVIMVFVLAFRMVPDYTTWGLDWLMAQQRSLRDLRYWKKQLHQCSVTSLLLTCVSGAFFIQ